MARTKTRAELRTRLEQITDTENDAHLSTTEKNEILNSAIAETWDHIVSAGLAEKYVKSATFSTVADTLEYNLETICTDGDFYRIHQLYVDEGSGQLRPLTRLAPAEIQSFRPPSSVVSMKLYYIPSAPMLESGDDSETFDGINGWEEHTLMTAACAVKFKKDDDYNQFYRRKKELEQRIASMGNIDFGEPARVVRKRKRSLDPFLMYRNNINAYCVRGDKLELYYNYGYIP